MWQSSVSVLSESSLVETARECVAVQCGKILRILVESAGECNCCKSSVLQSSVLQSSVLQLSGLQLSVLQSSVW